VKQQTLTIPGANPINTVYQYDALHRLTVAAENAVNPIAPDCGQPNSWCEKYNYGAGGVGNRAMPEKTGVGSGYSVLGRPTSFTVQNRMAPEAANYQSPGWIYDGRGNVTRNLGNGTFAYDGENRMRAHCRLDTNPDPNPANCTATAGAGRTIYWYDGEGRRVKREEPSGAVTTYVYDAFGQLSAEYSTGAAVTVGRRFLTVDHLGSTRVVTDEGSAATVVERRDYFPFGEEIPSTQGSVRAGVAGYVSSERLGFTGKERDAEMRLDYFGARCLSSAQGRWTSPGRMNVPEDRLLNP
jgi:RHS repeat-associated protein